MTEDRPIVRVVGLGAGGHARVVLEALLARGGSHVVGLLDPRPELAGTRVLGVPVLGGDELLARLHSEGIHHAFVGIGSVGDAGARRRVFESLERAGFDLVAAIHPSAVVSPSVQMGRGPIILAGSVINAGARLGDDVIVNTGAIVEHDCVLEDHVHVATGARLSGAVHVGEGAHVGTGASIRQGVRVGRGSIVGVGAAVVSDVPEGVVVVGVPARFLRRVSR